MGGELEIAHFKLTFSVLVVQCSVERWEVVLSVVEEMEEKNHHLPHCPLCHTGQSNRTLSHIPLTSFSVECFVNLVLKLK